MHKIFEYRPTYGDNSILFEQVVRVERQNITSTVCWAVRGLDSYFSLMSTLLHTTLDCCLNRIVQHLTTLFPSCVLSTSSPRTTWSKRTIACSPRFSAVRRRSRVETRDPRRIYRTCVCWVLAVRRDHNSVVARQSKVVGFHARIVEVEFVAYSVNRWLRSVQCVFFVVNLSTADDRSSLYRNYRQFRVWQCCGVVRRVEEKLLRFLYV